MGRVPESKTISIVLVLQIVNALAMVGLYYLTHNLVLAFVMAGCTVGLFFADIVRDWVRKPYRALVLRRKGIPAECRAKLADIEDYRSDRMLTDKNAAFICAATGAAQNDSVGRIYGNEFMEYADRFTHDEVHAFLGAVSKRSVYDVSKNLGHAKRYLRTWEDSGRPFSEAVAILDALGIDKALSVVGTDLPVEYATALA